MVIGVNLTGDLLRLHDDGVKLRLHGPNFFWRMRRSCTALSTRLRGSCDFFPLRRVSSAQSRLGDTLIEFRGVIDKRTERPEPWFVASPARDGGAIDRLPGLPLTGGLHRARIAFGAQA